MKLVTVFYANRVYEESDLWIPTRDLPDGAFIYVNGPNAYWHLVQQASSHLINLSDVPKELRTIVLLMS